jgi:carboxylesterase type B
MLRSLLLAASLSVASFASAADPARISSGLVEGVAGADASVTVYRGIPFAAAPVGDLRWRAPQPSPPWAGIRRADRFAAG